MQDIFKTESLCWSCAKGSPYSFHRVSESPICIHPTWTEKLDTEDRIHYDVPEVLKILREGEKLLIQQVSVYVPLHHLSYGQLGAKGHIVSFPQDISEVCSVLPRLPKDVSTIKVVKYFKLPEGEIESKSFSI